MTNRDLEKTEYASREEYISTQVERSRNKFGYCKVSFQDVYRYKQLLLDDQAKLGTRRTPESILCLGVRSGAEVDIFRSVFFGLTFSYSFLRNRFFKKDSSKLASKKLELAKYGKLGAGSMADGRVQGVEINPDIVRPDVHVASFDDLPLEWSGKFDVIFSNSFDHSIDPTQTLHEWKRVASSGAYLVIAFPRGNKPTRTDPLGGLTIDRMRELVSEELVYASETLNLAGYHEVCFRL